MGEAGKRIGALAAIDRDLVRDPRAWRSWIHKAEESVRIDRLADAEAYVEHAAALAPDDDAELATLRAPIDRVLAATPRAAHRHGPMPPGRFGTPLQERLAAGDARALFLLEVLTRIPDVIGESYHLIVPRTATELHVDAITDARAACIVCDGGEIEPEVAAAIDVLLDRGRVTGFTFLGASPWSDGARRAACALGDRVVLRTL